MAASAAPASVARTAMNTSRERELPGREIDRRLGGLTERHVAHVAHHAHDLVNGRPIVPARRCAPGAFRFTPSGPMPVAQVADDLADRRLVGQVASRERLVDDDHAGGVGAIEGGERAPLRQLRAHRLEVAVARRCASAPAAHLPAASAAARPRSGTDCASRRRAAGSWTRPRRRRRSAAGSSSRIRLCESAIGPTPFESCHLALAHPPWSPSAAASSSTHSSASTPVGVSIIRPTVRTSSAELTSSAQASATSAADEHRVDPARARELPRSPDLSRCRTGCAGAAAPAPGRTEGSSRSHDARHRPSARRSTPRFVEPRNLRRA